eukprot:3711348-Rhodomonas_salina.1
MESEFENVVVCGDCYEGRRAVLDAVDEAPGRRRDEAHQLCELPAPSTFCRSLCMPLSPPPPLLLPPNFLSLSFFSLSSLFPSVPPDLFLGFRSPSSFLLSVSASH